MSSPKKPRDLAKVISRLREARDAIDACADAMQEAGIIRGRFDLEMEAARFDKLASDFQAILNRRRGAK